MTELKVLEELEELKLNKNVLNEWKQLLNELKNFNDTQLKDYIFENMEEDSENLKKSFLEDFKDIPDKNPLKTQMLILLSRLGITIYKDEL